MFIALRPWIFLLTAIASELIAVTVMKLVTNSNDWLMLLFMYFMIGLSFYLLSSAVKTIPLALSYATWETIGLISVTCIGYLFFDEALNLLKLSGIALLLIGVLLVSRGTQQLKNIKPCRMPL